MQWWSQLRHSQYTITGVVLGIIIASLVLPPIWFLIQGSLFTTGADFSRGVMTFQYYERLLNEPKLFTSGLNSAIFAIGSSVIALLFGAILAWVVERTNAAFKALAYLTTIISLGTPFVLYVGAWLFLFGRAGPVNDLYRLITGNEGVLINVYSMTGMILIEGFLWSPLVFLLLSATFRTSNPEYEEAARMCGASVWDTLRLITFKLSLPSILALALLVFIRALEAFEVPALVGLPGRINVLTTDIFLDLHDVVPPDFGHASAFSVVLLLIVGVLLAFYNRLSKSADRYHTITGKGYRARLFDLGAGRHIATAIIVVNFVVILVLPLLALVWASLLPFFQPIRLAGFKLFTLENYQAVLSTDFYLELLWNTLFIAAVAATAAMGITLIAGWLAARRKKGAWILDQLATMPLIFPGIVLGVAVMQIYLAVPIPIYGTVWILIIAFVIRYLPYGMRYSYAGMLQIHHELEEAAGVCGASPMVILRRIILPLLAPSVLSGWLFIFLLATRVLSLPILLAGPESQVVAVEMFDLWTNGQGTELAALGLVWTAVMTVIASLFFYTARKTGAAAYGN
ncbi:MAG: iron ABC transporter permease [Proteobacteria bacterium]|nr:iron ABC transporter permease [Pseudomonadota bacterium]